MVRKTSITLILLVWVISSLIHLLPAQPVSGSFSRLKLAGDVPSTDVGVGLWAWPLPMDYDADGDMDLLVACPDVPFNGIYFFENKDGSSMTVFAPPVRIGDGRRNLQVSYVEDEVRVMSGATWYRNWLEAGLAQPDTICAPCQKLEAEHAKVRFRQWKWVDYENDGDLDLLIGIDDWSDYGWDNAYDAEGNWTNGPLHGYVYLVLREEGEWEVKGRLQAGGRDIDVYGAPTPNMADFDGDGDLDLICGEFLDKLTWFENTGSRTRPEFAPGIVLANEAGPIRMDLQMIIPVAVDWDQDGDVDLVIGDEDGRVALVLNTGEVEGSMPRFESPRYFRQVAQDLKFGALVTPAAVDWDGDGDQDLVCGNTAGYLGWVEHSAAGPLASWQEPRKLTVDDEAIRIMAGENGSIQGPCEAKWGYTTPSIADWDGDGLPDLIVNSIWGKVILFRNDGTPGHPHLAAAEPVKVQWPEDPPKPAWTWWSPDSDELVTQWRTTPYAIDWNEDGMMDLVMLDHEGYLAFYQGFRKEGQTWVKPGQRIFYGVNASQFDSKNRVLSEEAGWLQLNAKTAGSSGRRKFCFVDWDEDGDQDLFVNSLNVAYFENTTTDSAKVSFYYHGDISEQVLAGHTTAPTIWTAPDGSRHLITGAEDGFFYLFHKQGH